MEPQQRGFIDRQKANEITQDDMTAGRGFIALAGGVPGGRHPVGTMFAARQRRFQVRQAASD